VLLQLLQLLLLLFEENNNKLCHAFALYDDEEEEEEEEENEDREKTKVAKTEREFFPAFFDTKKISRVKGNTHKTPLTQKEKRKKFSAS